jgi:hypothetical protein
MFMKYVLFAILGLAGLFALNFAGNAFGFWQYSFFAPKIVAVQNKVFQESQPYNEGMIRDLENIQRQYVTATGDSKEALRQIALHRFEVYDINRLPPDLQNFYRSIQ